MSQVFIYKDGYGFLNIHESFCNTKFTKNMPSLIADPELIQKIELI